MIGFEFLPPVRRSLPSRTQSTTASGETRSNSAACAASINGGSGLPTLNHYPRERTIGRELAPLYVRGSAVNGKRLEVEHSVLSAWGEVIRRYRQWKQLTRRDL